VAGDRDLAAAAIAATTASTATIGRPRAHLLPAVQVEHAIASTHRAIVG
jgi:hypothetical protein